MSDHITLSKVALDAAMSTLSDRGFKLYMALVRGNFGESAIALPLTVIISMGLSKDPGWCTKARQELVNLGFLTLVEAPCKYYFNPLGAPDAAEKAAAERAKKAARLRKKEGGTVEKRAPARDVEAWELVDF